MAEVGHIAKGLLVPAFIRRGVKACVVPRKLAALGCKLRPPPYLVDGIQFLNVTATVMVDDDIGIDVHTAVVGSQNQAKQFVFRTKPGLFRTFLINISEVIKIVGIVSHRYACNICRLARRRQPERGKARRLQR